MENPENSLNKRPAPKEKIAPMDLEKNKIGTTEKLPTDVESSETEEKDFGARLDDLKAAILEMDQHGEQVTEEMFERIMGMPFSEFEIYTNGGKNIADPDLKNFHTKISGIINGELNEAYEGNRFQKIMNKPLSKALFVSLCLFLKFGTAAQAHNNNAEIKDRMLDKTELKAPDNFDGDPNHKLDNTKNYQPDIETFSASDLKAFSEINITQGFEVDKDEIPEERAQEIKSQVENFLNKINSSNFEQFKNAKKVIYVSSDERATKYGAEDKKLAPTLENNINLSGDRFIAGEKIIQEALQNNDYSSSDLNEEQIKEIQATKFERSMPEKGYTKIIELNKINPETGEKYTKADVKIMRNNNPKLYQELNDECRYVKLDLMVESPIQKINHCDRVLFFIDNSPSTEHTMNNMANELEKLGLQENDKGNIPKADLVYYSNKADKVKNLDNILEAAEDLRQAKAKGSSIENPFKSSIEYLKGLIESDKEATQNGGEIEDYRSVIYTTDEGLQDAQNIFEAVKLAQEANVKDANIFLYGGPNQKPIEKNLFELKDNIEEAIKAKLDFNRMSLEQQQQDAQQNLQQLIAEANLKVSPETLQEAFGQSALDNNDRSLKILIPSNEQAKYLRENIKSSSEKSLVYNLFKASKELEKTQQLLSAAQNQSFEDYLANTQIEIKTFTDENGSKVDFNVLGYENLASNISRTAIKL